MTEHTFFAEWAATLHRHADLQAQILDDTLQRPAELEWSLERGVSIDVVRHARLNQGDRWAALSDLLSGDLSISEMLSELFGKEVPVTVAAAAVEAVVQDEPESGRPDGLLGRELRKREEERKEIGLPRYLWVVTLRSGGKTHITVMERANLKGPHCGLVKVVDAR